MRPFILLLLAFLLFLLAPGTARCMTIHVPADQPTIQAGINAAAAGDTVLVAAGTYQEHDILMRSLVVLRSEAGVPAGTTIDAGRLGRVLACVNLWAGGAIEGFTLTGGSAYGYGSDGKGGGILMDGSPMRVRNCLILNNESEGGGGALALYRSDAVFEDCVLAGNRSIDGGGLYLSGASPRLERCLLYDNSAQFFGGGVFMQAGCWPVFRNCTLVENEGRLGGGLCCVYDSSPVLENTLIAFSRLGVGIYADPNPGHPSVPDLSCCDVFGNADANYGGSIADQTGINGNISIDPLFCEASAGNFYLDGASPCLPQNNECRVLIGALPQGCGVSGLAIRDAEPRSILGSSAPNPFCSSTAIGFDLPGTASVSVRLFDSAGRLVRELASDRIYPAGAHQLLWDGRDGAGRELPSGVYHCRLQCGTTAESRTLSLLK